MKHQMSIASFSIFERPKQGTDLVEERQSIEVQSNVSEEHIQ